MKIEKIAVFNKRSQRPMAEKERDVTALRERINAKQYEKMSHDECWQLNQLFCEGIFNMARESGVEEAEKNASAINCDEVRNSAFDRIVGVLAATDRIDEAMRLIGEEIGARELNAWGQSKKADTRHYRNNAFATLISELSEKDPARALRLVEQYYYRKQDMLGVAEALLPVVKQFVARGQVEEALAVIGADKLMVDPSLRRETIRMSVEKYRELGRSAEVSELCSRYPETLKRWL